MAKIKFCKEPGFTYDLLFLFMLYNNKVAGMKLAVNKARAEEDKEYYSKVLEPFWPMSDDLLVFFYLKDGNRFFMSEKYFDSQSKTFGTEDCCLQNILSDLSDYDKVVRNVLGFYFRDIPEKELKEIVGNLPAISRRIRASEYPEEIKNALYAFFIEPAPMVQKLVHELLVKEVILEQRYQKEYQKLMQAQGEFDYEWVAERIVKLGDGEVDIKNYESIMVSFCIQHKNIVYFRLYSDRLVLMLGWDYQNRLEDFVTIKKLPELDMFGNVVSERNRVEILNLMKVKGEVSIKDIECELGLTATNAYYHLMLMEKADMLKYRNVGRTMFYSIKKEYFSDLCKLVEVYAK